MSMRRTSLAVALGAILLTGCSRGPTPTLEVPTPEPAAFDVPEMTVVQAPVQYRESELEQPQELTAGEVLTVTPGANMLVGDGGRADLVWPQTLTSELLSGTDALLSQSDATSRQIIVDQATGTARYELQPTTPATLFTVKAAWADLEVSADGGSAVVSYIPGTDPSVWFVVLSGSGQVKRGTGEVVSLGENQAVGLTESSDVPTPQGVDGSAVQAWLAQVSTGTPQGSIASVALRCSVASDGLDFLAQPDADAEAAGEPLTTGTSLEVIERDEAASWLRVRPLATMTVGWVDAAGVACNGPIQAAAVSTSEAPTPTTAPLRPVVTIVRPVATIVATPTVTPTPVGAVKIYFGTTDDSVMKGTCSKLVWEVQGIKEVYVDGRGVTGKGEMEVCPEETTTYTMKVVHTDGRVEERSVEIEVREPEDTKEPEATATSEPPTAEPGPTAGPTSGSP